MKKIISLLIILSFTALPLLQGSTLTNQDVKDFLTTLENDHGIVVNTNTPIADILQALQDEQDTGNFTSLVANQALIHELQAVAESLSSTAITRTNNASSLLPPAALQTITQLTQTPVTLPTPLSPHDQDLRNFLITLETNHGIVVDANTPIADIFQALQDEQATGNFASLLANQALIDELHLLILPPPPAFFLTQKSLPFPPGSLEFEQQQQQQQTAIPAAPPALPTVPAVTSTTATSQAHDLLTAIRKGKKLNSINNGSSTPNSDSSSSSVTPSSELTPAGQKNSTSSTTPINAMAKKINDLYLNNNSNNDDNDNSDNDDWNEDPEEEKKRTFESLEKLLKENPDQDISINYGFTALNENQQTKLLELQKIIQEKSTIIATIQTNPFLIINTEYPDFVRIISKEILEPIFYQQTLERLKTNPDYDITSYENWNMPTEEKYVADLKAIINPKKIELTDKDAKYLFTEDDLKDTYLTITKDKGLKPLSRLKLRLEKDKEYIYKKDLSSINDDDPFETLTEDQKDNLIKTSQLFEAFAKKKKENPFITQDKKNNTQRKTDKSSQRLTKEQKDAIFQELTQEEKETLLKQLTEEEIIKQIYKYADWFALSKTEQKDFENFIRRKNSTSNSTAANNTLNSTAANNTLKNKLNATRAAFEDDKE